MRAICRAWQVRFGRPHGKQAMIRGTIGRVWRRPDVWNGLRAARASPPWRGITTWTGQSIPLRQRWRARKHVDCLGAGLLHVGAEEIRIELKIDPSGNLRRCGQLYVAILRRADGRTRAAGAVPKREYGIELDPGGPNGTAGGFAGAGSERHTGRGLGGACSPPQDPRTGGKPPCLAGRGDGVLRANL